MVLESKPVGSRGISSVSDLTIVVDIDLEGDWSTKEEMLSVETSGGVGDELWVDRLSVWRRRSRRRSTDMVAERTEKEGSIVSNLRKVETSSPGPMGEDGGGVENVQWYIGRRDLGD